MPQIQITKDNIKDIAPRKFASITEILDDMEKQLDQFVMDDDIDIEAGQTHWLTEVSTNVEMDKKWLALLRAKEGPSTREAIQARIAALGARIEAIQKTTCPITGPMIRPVMLRS